METKLDLKDRKILNELDINSRQSFTKISKAVGLSKEVVNYRIKRLIKEGIIKSFYPIINITKLGFSSFRIFLRFQNLSTEKEKGIVNYLKNQDSVGWIVSVKGNWDINFVTWNTSNKEFQLFWKGFLEKYKSNLSDYKISIITQLHQYSKSYILDKKGYQISVIGENEELKIDKTDYNILKILSKNCRETSLEIAEKIHKTEKVVRDRIKRLIKNKIILGFSTVIDLNKIGYSYFKLHLNLNNFDEKEIKGLLDYSKINPNIIYYTETIGGYDFELDIHAKNSSEFFQIIKNIKNKFPKLIKDFEFLQYDEEYKMSYLPEIKY